MMGGGGMMGGYGLGSWGWAGALLNLVIYMAVFGGLIWLVLWLIRQARSNDQKDNLSGRGDIQNSQTPEQILKSRYARGEINREEYTRILQDLAS